MTSREGRRGPISYEDMPAEGDQPDSSPSDEEIQGEILFGDVDLPDEVEGYSKRRVELVQQAVKEWTHQLIDVGGRNNLLNYRDLKRGTLDLTECQPTARSRLLQGKPTKISALISGDDARESALRRVRTIYKKAKENFDERGIETLSLACGLASWEQHDSAWQPHAPVLIRRASLHPLGAARDDFELTLLDEMEVSSTLLHVLKAKFDCEFDDDDLLDRMDGVIDESWELEQAFDWMRDQATGVPGFDVEPRLVLANFAYTKLPMVRDLESAFKELVAHDLIAAIAGDEDARAAIRSAEPSSDSILGPDAVPPKDEFLILDADSSQSYAINAVLAGANLIIRGPPGTGKSQTIANLIGSLAAHGKKILFVAEKRAAIEAVLKRLRQKKLEDLVVDLHGGVSSRREFAQAIGRALAANRVAPTVDNVAELRRLTKSRKELNRYVAALHDTRGPWGLSAYDIRVELLTLEAYRNEIIFRGEVLAGIDAETVRRVEEDLAEYVGLGGPELSSSPWADARVSTQDDVQTAYTFVEELHRVLLPAAQRRLRAASVETGLPEAPTLSAWGARHDLLDDVEETLKFFQPAIFERDLDGLCVALAPAEQGRLARMRAVLFSGDYRRSRREIRELRCGTARATDTELLGRCKLAREQLSAWRSFGGDGNPSLPSDNEQLWTAYEHLMDGLEELEEWTAADNGSDLPISEVEEKLGALLNDRSTLVNLPDLRRLQGSLNSAGLTEFLAEIENSTEDLVKSFRHAWLRSIIDHLSLSDTMIGGFVPEKHERAVEVFQDGDRDHLEATPSRIKRICAESSVRARDKFKAQDDILRHQADLKRRHMPIRDLIRETSDVLLDLKPCWVMSPLVVSQLLPPTTQFDVVIFDEASQITPPDAIPSILRGRQLVVAGDEWQLPPTAFFLSESPEDDEEEEGMSRPIFAGTGGFESILKALGNLFGHWKMLEWHYRSRDERLIAFSNAHIYDHMLTTFPGSGDDDVLRHELAPHDGADQTNSPTPEVETVVNLIIDHARDRPDETLGVIAMGIKHANRVEEALRQRLRGSPDLEEELSEFFDESREERFFVKNLERVQGDERDAIILSIGYGKDASGKLLYRFGPLLQEGGERRLNVAVTRAKRRITLVSSFSSKDMDPEKSAEGVKLLRQYLQYIESLGTNLGDRVIDKPALNPFEVDVRDTLERQGLKLVAQYGTSGYWIDFAVRHPDRPGDFVLAIECDGATYHSSESARDRDRLRQEQLERLGWRFCRIWSSEWFSHKEQAVKKVLAAYQDALEDADKEDDPSSPQLSHTPLGSLKQLIRDGRVPRREGSRPAVRSGLPIQKHFASKLVQLARWIESDGVLRTEDEMIGEMMTELGYRKRGKNVLAAIQSAIRQARK